MQSQLSLIDSESHSHSETLSLSDSNYESLSDFLVRLVRLNLESDSTQQLGRNLELQNKQSREN